MYEAILVVTWSNFYIWSINFVQFVGRTAKCKLQGGIQKMI